MVKNLMVMLSSVPHNLLTISKKNYKINVKKIIFYIFKILNPQILR
jgi:hypothetical protein